MALDPTIAILTLPEAKDFCKKTDDNDLAVFEALVNGVHELIRSFTGRIFPYGTYTSEYYDGNGWPDMWLNNKPITTLTSVYEDGILLTADVDYYAYLSEGRLHRIVGGSSSVWLPGPRKVKVSYVAGYSAASMPADLKIAAGAQLADLWGKQQRKSWGEVSRSLAGQSVTVMEQDMLPFTMTILKRYKRKVW